MITLPLGSSSWRFRDASTKSWQPASVPGCVHSDLLAAGKIPDPFFGTNELDLQWIEERDWEYRTVFKLPAALMREDVVELVADGLDTIATVFLNGKKIATTDNMFVAHRWNVRREARAGSNELVIRFRSALDYVRKTRADFTPPKQFSDPVGGNVRIRKQQCQFGWDWGPRFVTAGIWRDIRIEAWSAARLDGVRIRQVHSEDGSVDLAVTPAIAGGTAGLECNVVVTFDGKIVARLSDQIGAAGEGRVPNAPFVLSISDPQLWWPAGQGAQPLYDIRVELVQRGVVLATINRRIGLRTIVVDRHPDQWGESFQFVVNGRPVFVKGANWIPAHSFVAGLTRADYARDLESAVRANMNCVRVWGGGVYESEDFYDLCDELGLLVWQDFMFACALYPSDEPFVESVRAEAAVQVRRLHHRACLALWCGNNELVMLHGTELRTNPEYRVAYEKLFNEVLPQAIAAYDGVTDYWPSSDWRGTYENGHELGEKSGDTHFWGVWHGRQPVKEYERWKFRFISEFGMQSYSSPTTNATFCPPGDSNVFGPSMENHQKNRAGNQIILDYVSRRYRLPKTQDDLIYLSQLNQAYCMRIAVEHYRRISPRCMGTIYWQLNDCWPVASWSSIEFTGRWKALHYAARRFYAPALVSAHVAGEETTVVGNYRRTTIGEVDLYTVYDAPEPTRGVLRWDLFHFDGRGVLRGKQNVVLQSGGGVKQKTLDVTKAMSTHGRDHLYLRIALDVGGVTVSEDAVFLAPPRFLSLPKVKARTTIKMMSTRRAMITFRSEAFLHAVAFDLAGLGHSASDNYFDLHAGEPRAIVVDFEKPVTSARIKSALRYHSLVDTFV